ncbi:GntR family transcriptional regulator [Zhihengliuella salsuginis]|uniref:GntR family transcriptional regulator n=1 Tax=Zhihengliuella salsuginis TaxID=578222 RepID=A0ABQ3GGU0_9MICC|nr:GntR family transcriptional regulator [Zhihengliuella salsuginis]GHD05696.1 GntR family transcriptional regulator [Zhihengliuella salsuginis]
MLRTAPSTAPPLAAAPVLSRRDSVVLELRRAVVRGVLRPGDKLTEINLSKALAVSRPTLREALNQLAQEGLLVQEPYRGLRVARLDAAQIMDGARTRHALDMLAVDELLADSTGERMDDVEAYWRDFERLEHHRDPLTRHEAHIAFHRGIWAASGNSVLLRMWPVTEAHLTIALGHEQAVRPVSERADEGHRRLIAALHTRDRTAIESAFRAHTVSGAQELVSLIEAEGQEET